MVTIISPDLDSGDFSSDDDDEGFENPMDDNDDDDLEDEDDDMNDDKHGGGHMGGGGANGIGVLPPDLVGEHHRQCLGGKIEDSPDDEIEEEATGEVLPGEGEAVHDEGGAEPVEVHDEEVDPESRVLHDVQEPAPTLVAGHGLGQNNILRLHWSPVLFARIREDLLGLVYPGLRNEPPRGLREPEEDDGAHRHHGGDAAQVPVPVTKPVNKTWSNFAF